MCIFSFPAHMPSGDSETNSGCFISLQISLLSISCTVNNQLAETLQRYKDSGDCACGHSLARSPTFPRLFVKSKHTSLDIYICYPWHARALEAVSWDSAANIRTEGMKFGVYRLSCESVSEQNAKHAALRIRQ